MSKLSEHIAVVDMLGVVIIVIAIVVYEISHSTSHHQLMALLLPPRVCHRKLRSILLFYQLEGASMRSELESTAFFRSLISSVTGVAVSELRC